MGLFESLLTNFMMGQVAQHRINKEAQAFDREIENTVNELESIADELEKMQNEIEIFLNQNISNAITFIEDMFISCINDDNVSMPILLSFFTDIMNFDDSDTTRKETQIQLLTQLVENHPFVILTLGEYGEPLFINSYMDVFENNKIRQLIYSVGTPSKSSYAWYSVYKSFDFSIEILKKGFAIMSRNFYNINRFKNFVEYPLLSSYLLQIDLYSEYYI